MTTLLDASTLSLREVHRLLNLERQLNHSFTSLLSLAPLTELEQQDLDEICTNFYDYYADKKISEGEVKFLTISPLLWLSGFYNSTIKQDLRKITIKPPSVGANGYSSLQYVVSVRKS